MDVEVAVVGGGVVGLACAAGLARSGRSVVVLEREPGIARGITSRNSEVIHAGIYYPEGSLKAELCVRGRELLYERCQRLGLPHRQLGKLIVASSEAEESTLEELARRGTANGAPGLRLLEAAELARLEPQVRARSALLSPRSGVVDAHALCLSYQAELESHGGDVVLQTEVVALDRPAAGFRVTARSADGEEVRIECAALVNAAGLGGERIVRLAGLDPVALGYRLHPCKGDYFAVEPGAPVEVSHLVYPVPARAGLGVHVTVDLGGRLRLGPDTEYVDAPRFDVDPAKAEAFAEAAGRYLPQLRAEWLTPDYAGVRPKLQGPGDPVRDFVVCEESDAGCPGLVDLIGIESPGLTAAPAIAERVEELLAA